MTTKSNSLEWINNNYHNLFNKFNLDEKAIFKYYNSWKATHEIAANNDFLWSVFQQLLDATAKQAINEEALYRYNYEIYKEMWHFLVYVEHKNANHVKNLMHENELKLWDLTQTIEYKIAIISGHCCKFCDSLNRQIMSFEEAIFKQYLASNKCTRERGCNCCYSMVSQRDENGRAIRRQNK